MSLRVVAVAVLIFVTPLYSVGSDSPSGNATTASAIRKWIYSINPTVTSTNADLIVQSVIQSGERYHVDPTLLTAIISVESQFNHRAAHRGAFGLGQLMRGTGRRVGIEDPFSITQNVTGTTVYFSQLMAIWNGSPQQTVLALASYLRGPDLVKRSNGTLSPRTKRYVGEVLRQQAKIVAIDTQSRELPTL